MGDFRRTPEQQARTRKPRPIRASILALCTLIASSSGLNGQQAIPPLIDAASGQDWVAVERLLREGADPRATAADGATPLHWASYWDQEDAARLLLDGGAEVDAANDMGATALWNASLTGSEGMIRLLLEAGADPDAALLSGETPVMTAARTGKVGALELLLEAGGDPNALGARDQTALMWAASQKHPDAVRTLLDHGADIHARSETWSQVMAVPPHSDPQNQKSIPHGANTPLLFAARVGDLESARVLIDRGANVDDTDAWGVSAMVLAAHSGYSDLLELLLEEGADPNVADAGFSALHIAIMRRDEAMVHTLLEHGVDPRARLQTWTPVRRASDDWHFHPSLVGASPFWLAARLAEPGIMRLLSDHGADPLVVHEADYVGYAGAFGAARIQESTTALMAAVGMGGPRRLQAFVEPDRAEVESKVLEAVRLCVELGIDVDARDLEGRTALDEASHPSVVEFLSSLSD